MPDLTGYIALLERLQSNHLEVDARRCLAVRNRNAPCRRCAEACTSGCISLHGNRLEVDAQRCTGCGTCATACPTGALEARMPDDRELAAQAIRVLHAAGGVVTFACAPAREAAAAHLDPELTVGVACLGRIDESLIILLAAASAPQVRLVCGTCDACPRGPGIGIARRVCDDAATLLDAWGSHARVELSERFPRVCRRAEHPVHDAGRRDFFRTVGDAAKSALHETAGFAIERVFDQAEDRTTRFDHVQADGALPRHLPARRALLLDMLTELGRPDGRLVETRLWGHAVIDEDRCSGCAMCAVFCPTGALSKTVDERGPTLVHAPGLCVQCRCCEALCPEGALTVSQEVFAADVGAGVTDRHPLHGAATGKKGPDAIRNSMQKLIDSPYLWG